jgi:molecular chaperone HtpG
VGSPEYANICIKEREQIAIRGQGRLRHCSFSSGGGECEIAPASKGQTARIARGTEIVLHLKADVKRYAEPDEIRRIVAAYSDHTKSKMQSAGYRGLSSLVSSHNAETTG